MTLDDDAVYAALNTIHTTLQGLSQPERVRTISLSVAALMTQEVVAGMEEEFLSALSQDVLHKLAAQGTRH